MTTDADADIATRASPRAASAPAGLALVVLSGQARGHSVALGERARVGKAPDNELVLPDDTVSRHHCELERRADGVLVRDLGSTNGTRLGGAKVREAVAAPGAVVTVGDVEVVLRATPRRVDVLPSERRSFGRAIGESLAMRSLFGVLERIAPTDATVLLEGETGTGKDVLARAIHDASPRAKQPFVVVDCGAVSYTLIESELFGHERGAFTGAVAARRGAFELADGGTLFLDEIGELPLDVQPKLLRLIETRELRRVGVNRTVRADVRIVAATKRELLREVERGKFREDLYFRLAVVPLTVAPLRARREDVAPLVRLFLAQAAESTPSLGPLHIADDTLAALAAHDWPGNVRELRNVLERAVYLARAAGDTEVTLVTLPSPSPSATAGPDAFAFQPSRSYRETRAAFEAEFERRYVQWLLGRHADNVSAAAREVQMDRKYLYDLAKRHGLRGRDGADGGARGEDDPDD